MSGGRFLVALGEVRSSEKIIQMKTLAKEGIQFWELDLQPNGDHMGVSGILEIINQLNRGGLRIPSKHLSTHVIEVFAVLDVVKELLIQHFPDKIKNASEETLKLFATTEPFL